MFHLLLIDVAACAALIVVAALVMVGRWRRRRRRRSMAEGQRRMAVAGRVGAGLTPAGVVPGLGTSGMQPGPGRGVAPEPAHAARPEHRAPPVREWQPQPAHGGRTQPGAPPVRGSQPRPARAAKTRHRALPVRGGQPEQPAPPGPDRRPAQAGRAAEAAHLEPSRNGPGPAPEQYDTAGDGTSSERIGSYYDEADRPMSDYLAELGWGEEPGTGDTR